MIMVGYIQVAIKRTLDYRSKRSYIHSEALNKKKTEQSRHAVEGLLHSPFAPLLYILSVSPLPVVYV